ncbi:MAG TPA: type II secretion system protein GspE, partial [Pseudomonas sp.]|nr:type II secretion system protein GspE [Pseudomonas sp.]
MSEQQSSVAAPTAETGYRYARRVGILTGAMREDGQLEVFVRADCDPQGLLELRRRHGCPLLPIELDDDAFAARLRDRYERSANDAMQFVEGLGEDADLLSVAQSLAEPEDLLESQDEAPIIRLINALLSEAVKENASDIHIEPFENRLSIRLRVDGVLREVLEPPRALAPVIVSRIKVMAKLDIAEKRLPQDGRIGLRLVGRAVDVRVSTLPSGHGERVVLRLLDKQAGRLELRQLGMCPEHYAAMERVISRPHGVVLVTGPTGSGK